MIEKIIFTACIIMAIFAIITAIQAIKNMYRQ